MKFKKEHFSSNKLLRATTIQTYQGAEDKRYERSVRQLTCVRSLALLYAPATVRIAAKAQMIAMQISKANFSST